VPSIKRIAKFKLIDMLTRSLVRCTQTLDQLAHAYLARLHGVPSL